MSKVKTNFLTPIKGADYIAPDEIQEECRDRWRNASWTSDDDARQLEYLKLNTAERLQYFIIHGGYQPMPEYVVPQPFKSETEDF